MKKILLFLSLFASTSVFAAGEVRIWPVMFETRFETGETQDLESKNIYGLSAGYSYKGWAMMLEYSQFDQKTGNSYSEVLRKHQELIGWVEPNLLNWGSLVGYGSVGLGYGQEQIESTLGSQNVAGEGGDMMYGAGLGVRLRMEKHILFKFSTKAMFGESLQPNPNFSYQFGLGFAI